MAQRTLIAIFLALVGATALVLSPALTAGFVYEDLRWLQTDYTNAIKFTGRPLLVLSYIVQFGQSPQAFHLVGFALHALCAALLVRACLAWGLSRWAALVAAAAFLLSPAVSQAAVYASARGDLILAVLVLLAAGTPTPARLMLAGLVAALVKDAAMPLAGLLCAAGAWQWTRRQQWSLVPWVAIGFALPVLFFLVVERWVVFQTYDVGDPTFRLAAVGRHALLFAWPWMGPTIDFDPLAASPAWPAIGFMVVLVLATFIRSVWWVLPASALALVLPRVLLSAGDLPQEHHLYVVHLCLAAAVGAAWDLVTYSEVRHVAVS